MQDGCAVRLAGRTWENLRDLRFSLKKVFLSLSAGTTTEAVMSSSVWSLLHGKKSWRSVNVFHAECRDSVSLDCTGALSSDDHLYVA